jgi:general secretion pathway protein I
MTKKFSGRRIEAGFTLLEVVVALTIVAMGVVTVLEIFSLGLRLVSRSSELSRARLYGQSVMDEVIVYGSPQSGQEEGFFPSGHRWTFQVKGVEERTVSLSSPWELKDVEVRYRETNREKQVELKTLRLFRKTAS